MRIFQGFLYPLLILACGMNIWGDTLFFDNFNDGNDNGWKKPGGGVWTVENGKYQRNFVLFPDTLSAISCVGDRSWRNYTVEMKAEMLEDQPGGWAVLCFRIIDSLTYYTIQYEPHSGAFALNVLVNGQLTNPVNKPYPTSLNVVYGLKATVKEDSIYGYINDSLVIRYRDNHCPSGGAGVATLHAHVHYDDFLVTLPDGTPHLVAVPSPTLDRRPLLKWQSENGADQYVVQVDTSASFLSPLISVPVIDTFFRPMADLPLGTFYWRVAGNFGVYYWSLVSRFIIIDSAVPVLMAYVPDTTDIRRPTLRWHKGAGALTYRIQIDTVGDFRNPWIATPVGDTFFTPHVNLPATRICWRVSNQEYDPGIYSAVDTFWVIINNPGESAPAADGFALRLCGPNPFSSAITFSLDGQAEVRIFSPDGRRVAVFENIRAGQIRWDAAGRPSGIYTVKASAGGKAVIRRICLIR